MPGMKVQPVTHLQWKQFCERTIEKDGNVSTKDAEEIGIPFGDFFELMVRLSPEQLKKNAEVTLRELQKRGV